MSTSPQTTSIKKDTSKSEIDYLNGECYVEVDGWTRYALRAAICSALHPFDYARTLIQLGYEPIAPVPSKSILNKRILALPNIFQYVSHIRRTNGFFGCYVGLSPKLFGDILGLLGSEKITEYLELMPYQEQEDDSKEEKSLYEELKINLKRDIVLSSTGLLISYPFQVISIRMMAQFIGQENIYRTILGSIIEIYKYEGFKGFYNGFIPKLLYELALVTLTSSSVYLANKYLVKERMSRQMNTGLTQITFTILLYPLKVVSTCMAITGSRLIAAKQPFLPQYLNWRDCFWDLHSRGEARRGSCAFMRCIPLPLKHFVNNSTASKSF